MADKKDGKSASKVTVKRKEKKAEGKPEKANEKVKEKEKKEEQGKKKPEKAPDEPKAEDEKPKNNGAAAEGAEQDGEFQPMELPPFEIVAGERINPFFFKFQFRNVEYSSGRNKTFLCFLVDVQGDSEAAAAEGLRGTLEDEHALAHVEEAFFQQVLPHYNKSLCYVVTWYTSSSPCAACAAKLVEVLRVRKTLRLTIFCSRLLEWEEPEVQAGLKALTESGCKLRMMKPSDFVYTWDTFVDNEEQSFTPWEDCQENYEYYEERLADILH